MQAFDSTAEMSKTQPGALASTATMLGFEVENQYDRSSTNVHHCRLPRHLRLQG